MSTDDYAAGRRAGLLEAAALAREAMERARRSDEGTEEVLGWLGGLAEDLEETAEEVTAHTPPGS